MSEWLMPGGAISHQIDFSAHRLSDIWNGHWGMSDFLWKIIKGKRTYLLNRKPCSAHLELLRKNQFLVIGKLCNCRTDGLKRPQLAKRWKALSDEDLTCSGLFVQATKPT